MTGCFQWVALHLTRLSRGDGLALFLLYYALSSVLTIFTSNDVSIMALTVSNTCSWPQTGVPLTPTHILQGDLHGCCTP